MGTIVRLRFLAIVKEIGTLCKLDKAISSFNSSIEFSKCFSVKKQNQVSIEYFIFTPMICCHN